MKIKSLGIGICLSLFGTFCLGGCSGSSPQPVSRTVTVFDTVVTITVYDKDSEDVLDLVRVMCDFFIGFEGEIPGAAPEQCGNYQEQNLDMAKYYIKKYKDALVNDRQLVYPE